jgi:uncharacterized protein with von Willebrand factor type A (vWA) domain
MKSTENTEALTAAADQAFQKRVEVAAKDLQILWFIDISGSMHGSIEHAKRDIAKLLPGMPPGRLHIYTFNTAAKKINLPAHSAVGVEAAFRGVNAGGGTDHACAIMQAAHDVKLKDTEDSVFFFVGDQQEQGDFVRAVQASNLRPQLFVFREVLIHHDNSKIVDISAAKLGIPVVRLDNQTFEDPYQLVRTVANLVASTPVAKERMYAPVTRRESLAEQIQKTPLLVKPAWAS